jgi:hypothetical protein
MSNEIEIPDVETFWQMTNDFVGRRRFPLFLNSTPRVYQIFEPKQKMK